MLAVLDPQHSREAGGDGIAVDADKSAPVRSFEDYLGGFRRMSERRGARGWRCVEVASEEGVARLGGSVSGTEVRADDGVLNRGRSNL